MSNLLTQYSEQDQQKIKDWTKKQGGAADISMAVSALGVKPITTVTPANNTAVTNNVAGNNNTPINAANPLVTQKGTNQYVTAFTGREQEGFDSWYNMLKSGGSFLPEGVEDMIRGTYEKEGDRAFRNTVGDLSSLTGGRVGAAASAAASQARNAYSQQSGAAIANANMQYAQMVLNGMRDYTGAVSGRDDAAVNRDFLQTQQGFNNNMAIGEATGYLPTNAMNVNNPWIVNGKPAEGIDFSALINAKKAVNPKDPDIQLLNQARNMKIQADPELMKKYGSTMTAGTGYETLSGKKETAAKEYNDALLNWQKDPTNSENIARLKNAQANLTSAGAAATNAATNKAELDWKKSSDNPDNITKTEENELAAKIKRVQDNLATKFNTLEEAYHELHDHEKEYVVFFGNDVNTYNKLLQAYKTAAGIE